MRVVHIAIMVFLCILFTNCKHTTANSVNMKGQKIYQRLLLKTTLLGKTPSEVKSILGTPDNSADNYIHTSLEYLYKKRTYDGDENVLDNNCIVKMERLLAGDGELASPYHVQDVIFQ